MKSSTAQNALSTLELIRDWQMRFSLFGERDVPIQLADFILFFGYSGRSDNLMHRRIVPRTPKGFPA
jgi:hypothetical protein